MNCGALIFAHNNSSIDYVKLAVFSAKQILKYLEIPVTLVTDDASTLSSTDASIFDKIIVIDNEPNSQVKKFYDGTMFASNIEWKNFSRSQVYELTPYDKTLVIDSDYVINSSVLKPAFEIDSPLQIYQKSFPLASWRDDSTFQRLSQYSVKFYWATAFIFEKTKATSAFFTLVSNIKDNWAYYKALYHLESPIFRNDFAFSIAIHIMNDQTDGDFVTELPGTMTYILDRDLLVSASGNKMQFLIEKHQNYGEYTLVKTTGLDVHVMNKQSLLRYIEGGSGV